MFVKLLYDCPINRGLNHRAVSELRKYGYLHTFGKKENTVWEIHEMPKMPQITSKKTRAKKARNDAQLNVNYDAHIDVMDGVVT